MENTQNEIILNKFAQKQISAEEIYKWFDELCDIEKKEIIRLVSQLIDQAGMKESDVHEAIILARLKQTYTPCVLLLKGNFNLQMTKVYNLPSTEYFKSFKLLINMFKIADDRRRSTVCANGCSHWWHNLNDYAEEAKKPIP